MPEQKIKFFDLSFKITLLIFLVLVGIICLFPFWFVNNEINRSFDFRDTGQIGDTIGGIMGPFIAIIASGLTFLAFWAQYKANQQQVHQFSEQKDQFNQQIAEQKRQFGEDMTKRESSEKLERFENKYYELVRFHRANMEEMNIGDYVFARKCFIRMYYEFRFCYEICSSCFLSLSKGERKKITSLTAIAYKIFFFGIGDISEKQHNFNTEELALFYIG